MKRSTYLNIISIILLIGTIGAIIAYILLFIFVFALLDTPQKVLFFIPLGIIVFFLPAQFVLYNSVARLYKDKEAKDLKDEFEGGKEPESLYKHLRFDIYASKAKVNIPAGTAIKIIGRNGDTVLCVANLDGDYIQFTCGSEAIE